MSNYRYRHAFITQSYKISKNNVSQVTRNPVRSFITPSDRDDTDDLSMTLSNPVLLKFVFNISWEKKVTTVSI